MGFPATLMYLDTSAIVAILVDEPERAAFLHKIEEADRLLTSPLSLFETVLAVLRIINCPTSVAEDESAAFIRRSGARVVDINGAIGTSAIEAYACFGRGRHKAALNMGDCFAYACAKHRRVPILCKGYDFVHTDIELA